MTEKDYYRIVGLILGVAGATLIAGSLSHQLRAVIGLAEIAIGWVFLWKGV